MLIMTLKGKPIAMVPYHVGSKVEEIKFFDWRIPSTSKKKYKKCHTEDLTSVLIAF